MIPESEKPLRAKLRSIADDNLQKTEILLRDHGATDAELRHELAIQRIEATKWIESTVASIRRIINVLVDEHLGRTSPQGAPSSFNLH